MIIRTTKALLLPAFIVTLGTLTTMAATPSTAPNEGDMAVSFNAGFAHAFDNPFDDTAPVFTGSFEYYTSARVSWRGLLGVTSLDSDFPGSSNLDATYLTGNALYNWEGGHIHPYVTGGVGVYHKNGSSNLPSKFDETTFGLNGGGGIDWFLGSRWALEFEGTIHGLLGENPNTLMLGTAGIKFWF